MEQTQEVMSRIREIEKGTSDKIRELERDAARNRVGNIFQSLTDSYQDITGLQLYF